MKKIFLGFILIVVANSVFAQFSGKEQLKQYIQDNIKDRRPGKISASDLQGALLGTIDLLDSTKIDKSSISNDSSFNNPSDVSIPTQLSVYNFVMNRANSLDSVTRNGDSITFWKNGNAYAQFKDSSFSGSYNDLIDKPIIPDISGKVDKTTTINGKALSTNITLAKSDFSDLNNVDNTSDISKPISIATQAALDLKSNITDAILNQQGSKENKVAWIRRATLDTLTNMATPALMFDWRSGSYLFQFDSKRLILSNGKEGMNVGTGSGFNYEGNSGNTNIGYNAGFLNNGTYNTLTGDRTGMYAKSKYSTGYGDHSLYFFSGNNTSAYGNNSGYFSDGDGLSNFGYYSGFGVNADSSTFVGANSGQVFDFSYSVTSATGHNVTYQSAFGVSYSGSDITTMTSNAGMVVGKTYPYSLTYTGTQPTRGGVDVINDQGKLVVISADSIILLSGANNSTFGSGSFNISITTRRLNNSQVFGNGARSDLSNQVVLGNDKITQQKWGGAGNIRWATNIQPSSGQVPVWDTATGQFTPLSITRIDTVLSSDALSAYSGQAFTLILSDTLQGGTFIYSSTPLIADNGIIFPATGKGGSWVREYDKTKGVNVDWFGSRKDAAIKKAITAAGINGTINFTGSGIYELNNGFGVLQGQTLNGNGATLKRVADSIVTLTQPVTTSSTYFIVNAVPSSWTSGQVQIFTDSTNTNQITTSFIIRTSGDTVFVNGAINKAFSAGAKVRKVFAMISATAPGVRIKNFVFDGNRDNVKANYAWSVNPTIAMTSTGTSSIEGCRFYNIPNENIVGHGLIVKNNYAQNTSGSFVHVSASWKSSGQQLIPMIIESNITDSTNQIPSSIGGHSEGAITNSYTPGYVTVVNNRFRNGKDGVFGFIQNTTSSTDGKYRNVLIANNYAENFSKIFSSIGVNTTTDTIKTGHIFVNGNTFNNCGINDWTSQQSNIDNNIDTIMIGNNLLVGGTVWNIPVQKSDSMQRYILNNPTSTPQGADINITGNIKGKSAAFTNISTSLTPNINDSSNAIATTAFVKQYSQTTFNIEWPNTFDSTTNTIKVSPDSYGTATLSGGTVTVSNSHVTANSKIIVTVNTPSGTQGFLSVPTASIIAGTSFIINSSSGTETSTVNWKIINK